MIGFIFLFCISPVFAQEEKTSVSEQIIEENPIQPEVEVMQSEDSGIDAEGIVPVEILPQPSNGGEGQANSIPEEQNVSFIGSVGNILTEIGKLGISIVNGVIKAIKAIAYEVSTRVLRIIVRKGQDNIVGSDTFPAGAIEYRVKNSMVEENSKIFISFTSDTGGRTWHISEKAPGHGFTIRLSDVAVEPLDFDYWIVLVGGDGAFAMGIDVPKDQLTEEEFIKKFQDGELEFLSKKTNFRFDDELKFKFKYKRKIPKNITGLATTLANLFYDEYSNIFVQAEIIDPYEGMSFDVMPEVIMEKNGEFSINLNRLSQAFREFQPGKYRIKIRIQDNEKVFIGEQEFFWGVLAINTSKSIYLPGEEAYIQMAVLDDQGNTTCDAHIDLEIIDPKGKKVVLTTLNRTIQYSGECGDNNVTRMPDYLARYEVNEPGTYQMTMTATTINGTRSITDSFEVRDQVLFDVERIGPTRIYPKANYEMRIKITANQDFQGDIFELIPASFEIKRNELIIQDGNTGEIKFLDRDPTIQKNDNGAKRILWGNIQLKQGDKTEITYVFDAPDISPYLYLLGPLNIGDFYETRKWQIASDTPDQKIEQQINIMDQEYSTSSTSAVPTDNSLGLVYWDETKYNGETIYFEGVLMGAGAFLASVSLYTESGEVVNGSTITRGTMSYGRVRTGSQITLSDNTKYTVRIEVTTGAPTVYIKAARLIVLQSDPTAITDTVSQIELGDNDTTTNTSYEDLDDIKYWNYTSNSYDPTPTAYFEATLKGGAYSGATQTTANRDPGTETTTSQTGDGDDVNWTNPDNIASDDDTNYAVANIGKTNGARTYYLEARGFDFDDIPDGATIKGIEMIMERTRDNCDSKGSDDYIYDEYIYIIRGGSVQSATGDNKASAAANWPTAAYEYRNYGDTHADLWGLTDWTVDHVRDENGFGVAMNVELVANAAEGDCDVQIDSVEMIIGYVVSSIATTSAALYTSGDAYVTEAELSSNSWELVRTSQSFSLTDGTDYKVKIKTSNASGTASIANAKVVLEQSDAGGIQATELCHQYINTATTSDAGAYDNSEYYNKFLSTDFSQWTKEAYFESTIKVDGNTGYAQLHDGTSPITNSSINSTSGTYERKITSSNIWSNLNSGNDHDTQFYNANGPTNTTTISSSWLIFRIASQAVTGNDFDSMFLVF